MKGRTDLNKDEVNAIAFIARSYSQARDKDKAITFIKNYINEHFSKSDNKVFLRYVKEIIGESPRSKEVREMMIYYDNQIKVPSN